MLQHYYPMYNLFKLCVQDTTSNSLILCHLNSWPAFFRCFLDSLPLGYHLDDQHNLTILQTLTAGIPRLWPTLLNLYCTYKMSLTVRTSVGLVGFYLMRDSPFIGLFFLFSGSPQYFWCHALPVWCTMDTHIYYNIAFQQALGIQTSGALSSHSRSRPYLWKIIQAWPSWSQLDLR